MLLANVPEQDFLQPGKGKFLRLKVSILLLHGFHSHPLSYSAVKSWMIEIPQLAVKKDSSLDARALDNKIPL